MRTIESKDPEHYSCSLNDFLEVFSHMGLAEYRIKDFYIIPEYVNQSLEVPITLWHKLNKLQKEEYNNPKIQLLLDNVVDHIILHFPFTDDLDLKQWIEMWYELTIGYLKYKINFNDYLVYITFQTPDYADNNYHCHIILFDLRPSEENNILLPAINKKVVK